MSDIYPIAVPKWGIEMVEGTIIAWNKQVGDSINKGDEVFEMESDKIVNVWESPVDGVLRRQIVEETDTAPVGGLLGVIAQADVDEAAIDAFIKDYSSDGAAPQSAVSAAAEPVAMAAPVGEKSRRTNPAVRSHAQEMGVDLESVSGTGRNGRITKEDVDLAASSAAASNADSTASTEDREITPLSATRLTIAKRLTKAKQEIPHYYLTAKYDIDGLLAYRSKMNSEGDQRVSVNDLLVWCVARALVAVPGVNVNLVGNDVHQFKHANIAVAIATDEGLYPATVPHADTLTPQEIAKETASLTEKAKSGGLTLNDISGASFTVSNLGMFGVSTFSAIINPPMCAILALGRGEQQVVVKAGAPAVATMVNATLSCDHRVIDGALGARFLDVLSQEIAAL